MATTYTPCPGCRETVVPAGRICFDCQCPTKQEREMEAGRLRERTTAKWRRFPLEGLGLLVAAGVALFGAVRARDPLAMLGSAVIAGVGLRWLRIWWFVLGVLLLTCCAGETFHACR